jgi:hypothetical protein
MMMLSGNQKGIQKLLDNADRWSYSHRVGNGEYTEKQQQKIVNKAFWNLNEVNYE